MSDPVPGCVACERDFPEAYISVLDADALAHLGFRPPLVEVTVDGRFALCPAHAAALYALIGEPRM